MPENRILKLSYQYKVKDSTSEGRVAGGTVITLKDPVFLVYDTTSIGNKSFVERHAFINNGTQV
jgi:hypothetical protein